MRKFDKVVSAAFDGSNDQTDHQHGALEARMGWEFHPTAVCDACGRPFRHRCDRRIYDNRCVGIRCARTLSDKASPCLPYSSRASGSRDRLPSETPHLGHCGAATESGDLGKAILRRRLQRSGALHRAVVHRGSTPCARR